MESPDDRIVRVAKYEAVCVLLDKVKESFSTGPSFTSAITILKDALKILEN